MSCVRYVGCIELLQQVTTVPLTNCFVQQVLQQQDLLFMAVGDAVQSCVSMLNKHFIEQATAFNDKRYFLAWHRLQSKDSPLQWSKTTAGTNREELVYQVMVEGKTEEYVIMFEDSISRNRPVLSQVFTLHQYNRVVKVVKQRATALATEIVKSLRERFPPSHMLSAMGIIQPCYYSAPGLSRRNFDIDIDKLADFYGSERVTVNKEGVETVHLPLVDADSFRQQSSWFYDYMTSMIMHVTDTQALWIHIDKDVAVSARISELQKLAHVLLSLPASSCEPERSFSQMALLKDAKRNRLKAEHLNVCMRLAKSRWGLDSFPLLQAHKIWLSSERYMV